MTTQIINYSIKRDAVSSGFDGEYFWAQARGGVIPGEPPIGCEQYGSDNTIWLVQINWEITNE